MMVPEDDSLSGVNSGAPELSDEFVIWNSCSQLYTTKQLNEVFGLPSNERQINSNLFRSDRHRPGAERRPPGRITSEHRQSARLHLAKMPSVFIFALASSRHCWCVRTVRESPFALHQMPQQRTIPLLHSPHYHWKEIVKHNKVVLFGLAAIQTSPTFVHAKEMQRHSTPNTFQFFDWLALVIAGLCSYTTSAAAAASASAAATAVAMNAKQITSSTFGPIFAARRAFCTIFWVAPKHCTCRDCCCCATKTKCTYVRQWWCRRWPRLV